jgi:UDP-glucose 4-epimerase
MQLTVIRDQLINEPARLLKDNTHVFEVKLVTCMDEYRIIFESLNNGKQKASTKVVILVDAPTTTSKGKSFPKQFKKRCSLGDTVQCYSCPENAHTKPGYKAKEKLLTTTTASRKIFHHMYLLPETWAFRETVI